MSTVPYFYWSQTLWQQGLSKDLTFAVHHTSTGTLHACLEKMNCVFPTSRHTHVPHTHIHTHTAYPLFSSSSSKD